MHVIQAERFIRAAIGVNVCSNDGVYEKRSSTGRRVFLGTSSSATTRRPLARQGVLPMVHYAP